MHKLSFACMKTKFSPVGDIIFGLSVSVSADLLHDPKKNPPKEVVSQILFVTLPCLSLDFLFLFATRRYVEFFDMARPRAAFVAQDIKSIIN